MGLFRPYQSRDEADPTARRTDHDLVDEPSPPGKNAPTPSRRAAEQARRERLHPTLSKKDRRARERAITRARQDQAYAEAELAPQRVLLRNFLDTRWTFSEFSWPLLMVSMAAFLASQWFPRLLVISSYAIWGMLAIILIETTLLWNRFKRLLEQRHPGAPRRGLVLYLTSRMISPRRFRRPPPAINRGDAI